MILTVEKLCRHWSRAMEEIVAEPARREYFNQRLSELLTDRSAMRTLFAGIADGSLRITSRHPKRFSRETVLYLDPRGCFSLHLFFHPPGEYTAIHDHTTWGVMGTAFGSLSIMEYAVRKQVSEGRVEFEDRRQILLQPGEVAPIRPWNEGIHQTGSPDDALTVMLSIYGRPGRRLHINTFDAETGLVRRRYPIKILRRMLARQAVEGLCGD